MFNFRNALLLALAAFGMGNAYAADVYLQTQSINKAMPDGTTVKMWVFAQCDTTGFTNCGAATNPAADAPGPRINHDISGGPDSLMIHVQNMLPVPVSLIVPGQKTDYSKATLADGQSRTRARSMTAEVAASGGEVIYTIDSTLMKTGTYIYQSGTAPSLQVPMGLYGALVVTDGTEPATSALAVFSEIDPTQNARVDAAANSQANGGPFIPLNQACVSMAEYVNSATVGYPCTIDYKPRHLMVNGGAGLDLSVAATGDTVLLRWANAGLKTHTPSIVGLDQALIAEDGNPYPGEPRKQSVIMLPAGGTVDATAIIPAGNTALALFDRQPGFRNDSELASNVSDTGPGILLGGITVGTPPAPVVASKIAVNDEYDVIEDTAFNSSPASVLDNDTATPVSLTVAVQPEHGVVSLNPADGTFTYTPADDYSGVDQFVYDADGERAHVVLNVSYVNDAPVANADSYGSNNTGSAITVAAPGVLANDTDVDGDAPLYAKVNGTTAGVTLNSDGSFTYDGSAPTNPTEGTTTFSYFACDDAAMLSCSAAPVSVVVSVPKAQSNIALTVFDENNIDLSATNFRWTVEEDVTWHPKDTVPLGGTNPATEVLALNFHKSYMPTVAQGVGATEFATLALDSNKHYYVSVLPADGSADTGHSMGGASFNGNATSVNVSVHTTPLPTAQISVLVFDDVQPTNGAWDTGEPGLGGFPITLEDAGGRYGASAGLLSYDAFGEPLTNSLDCFGTFNTDDDGVYVPGSYVSKAAFNGIVSCPNNAYTQAMGIAGQALIKNLYPGKYGVIVTPPEDQVPNWKQTSTIEGTKVIDAWVRAGEPAQFQEFGPPGWHAFVGFVNPDAIAAEGSLTGTNSVNGAITNAHMSRPPLQTIWDSGSYDALAHTRAWISVNSAGGNGRSYGVFQAAEDGSFSISGLPDGNYQLAIFDQYLDQVIAYRAFTIAGGASTDLGNIPVFNWFSRSEHIVFQDDGCPDGAGGYAGIPGNAIREDCELPLAEQNINLRWRDGTIYQAFPTDSEGFVPFDQTFPFFHWQVAEVDFARFKATGVTVQVDGGGDVSATGGVLAPQMQPDGTFSRTELGAALTEGFQGFLGQTNTFQWGKVPWPAGQNGGISGIVYHGITRAENDPRLAAAEPWEPGIAGATVRLYRKITKAPVAVLEGDDLAEGDYTLSMPITGTSGSYRAQIGVMDLDEFVPLAEDYNSKAPGGVAKVRMSIGSDSPFIGAPLAIRRIVDGDYALGAETIVLNESSLVFVAETTTDNWDDPDSLPTGCPGATAATDNPIFGLDPGADATDKCYDGLRNFNQVRPGIFDGGYAFGLSNEPDEQLEPGLYVVEVVPPPGTEILKEEDNNVGFAQSLVGVSVPVIYPTGGGGTFPDPAIVQDILLDVGLAQPRCVGTRRPVGAELTLFPGEPAPFATAMRPTCDRKEVLLTDQGQAAAEFWVVSQAPIATHFAGQILDDIAQEFSTYSPAFGEKWAPPYVPVSIRRAVDGKEIGRVVSDQYGRFNGLAPSTFSAALPSPSGFSPNMLITCMNDPGPIPNPANPAEMIVDPNYNPAYSKFCYTFQYMPGTTTYLDTPVLPVSAFASGYNPPDCALPLPGGALTEGLPRISSVVGNVMAGPIVGTNDGDATTTGDNGNVLTITSVTALGPIKVPNPAYQGPVATPGISPTIDRNFGFGGSPGTVMIGNTVLNVVSWSDGQIIANAPATTMTGQLTVTTTGGVSTEAAITVTVTAPGAESNGVTTVATGGSIQDAIDAANPGDTILLTGDVYDENVIMWKPVKLQGKGAGSTYINGVAGALSTAAWNTKMNCLFGIGGGTCSKVVDALPNQLDGAAGFATEQGATITVVAPFDTRSGNPNNRPANRFDGRAARIDGLSISGGIVGGGVYVNGYAHDLKVSNNDIYSNNGSYSGGVRIGIPTLQLDDPQTFYDDANAESYSFNDQLKIDHNIIRQNGGLDGAGAGVSIYVGTDSYQVTNNYICGNFTLGNGAGVGHFGLSDAGKINNNKILRNQSFDQAANPSGGGVFVAGDPLNNFGVLTYGSGDVNIEDNLIQSNQAGAGHGGGIRVQQANGEDIVNASNPNSGLFKINIVNNMIVNNVAGGSGGGISLSDTLRAIVQNNTVAHNDSTATLGGLIQVAGGVNSSVQQPAGISSALNSPELVAALAAKPNNGPWGSFKTNYGTAFSNPQLTSNIVWQNRSLYYMADGAGARLEPVASNNGPSCGTTFWDLGVIGDTYPANQLNVLTDNILSTTAGANPAFASDYCNGGRIDGTGPMEAIPAVDEAGATWIDVRFGPLTQQGDYHITAGSTAIDVASSGPATDIDGDTRPAGAIDIGADELIP